MAYFRRIVLSALLAGGAWSFPAGGAVRVLDGARHHLGVAGLPEWTEFATSTPHGRQLELVFSAQPNAGEFTLFLWQREVKTTWNVLLNGRKLGSLEPLAQPLVLALSIPAGALKAGENRLAILRPPSPLLDDIVVGNLTLDPRPRRDALAAAALDVAVTEQNEKVPCRLTLVDPDGALVPFNAAPGQRLAVRTGVVYTGDGRARLTLRAGTYLVYATRGFEYGVASAQITLAAGDTRHLALELRREVPTPGLVACDTHIHTLTLSKHGDATLEERMLTIAGEGIELAVATEHNHHADYRDPAAITGMSRHFTPVVGNEVTTKAGHFNAFPVAARGSVPDAQLTDWTELLSHIRHVTGAQIITLNHPRDVHAGFTPLGADNFNPATGELRRAPQFDCDAIEVVTSAALQSDVMRLYRDWFALLNRGYRLAAIGASDTHHVSQFILGQARTYAACRASDPAAIPIDEICASYRAGRLLVSMGLLTQMTVDGRYGVGDLVTELRPELGVAVEVTGPTWVEADRVELFANGLKIREQAIAPAGKVQKALVRWQVPRPRHDVHLVAIATGPGVAAPFWETARPYQPSSKDFTPRVVGSTNPIWIDGDGDGRFTAARGYAEELVRRAAGDPVALRRALAGFDNAVAQQATAALRPPNL
jgi:hypothetical protein